MKRLECPKFITKKHGPFKIVGILYPNILLENEKENGPYAKLYNYLNSSIDQQFEIGWQQMAPSIQPICIQKKIEVWTANEDVRFLKNGNVTRIGTETADSKMVGGDAMASKG
uniref:Uncharacterized protein n=1 Tax=Romanomermis culicivorax TaxID=13658 RepID=A0A915LA05_ROMCU